MAPTRAQAPRQCPHISRRLQRAAVTPTFPGLPVPRHPWALPRCCLLSHAPPEVSNHLTRRQKWTRALPGHPPDSTACRDSHGLSSGHTGASRPPTCTLRTPTAPTPSDWARPETPRSRLSCHVLTPRRGPHSPSLRTPAWPRGNLSACPRSGNTRKLLCLATAASAAANVLDLSHDERDGSEFSLILFSFSKECYWRTHHRSEHAGRGYQVRVAARDRDQPATCDTSG